MSNNNSENNTKSFLDRLIESRRNKNLRPLPLPKREEYYFDLDNIERSWTYPFNSYCNLFIFEAEQQLFNAFTLFELGYFDCAYYSLRSAIEISTTVVFLSDLPEEDRQKYIVAWNEAQKFPIRSKMIDEISKKGTVFVDMLNKMPDFFNDAKQLLNRLNKYVHKQGLYNFYVYINNPIRKIDTNVFIKIFSKYFERCIGVVAVMRLAIDPMPLLLMDEEILYRCPYTASDAFNEDFANEYIKPKTISQYKTTDLYLSYYNELIKREKMCKELFDVGKHQYIHSQKIKSSLDKLHLVFESDAISILLVCSSNKVVKVYCGNGMLFYFTDRNSNRLSNDISGETFARFLESENKINLQYDEALISVLEFNNTPYFIEHNEMLSEEEYTSIKDYVNSNMPTHFRNEN